MTRRTNERFQVWVPVKVGALREGIAVTHDASSRGVLMMTASTLDEGSSVEIALKLPDQPELRHVSGRVVRIEENPEDPHGLWPHRMAIEFDEPQPDLEWVLGGEKAQDRRVTEREPST